MPAFHPVQTLLAHSKPITACRYSPSGHTLATASADASVHLWDTSDPSGDIFHLRSLRGQHTKGINDIAWNSDGSYLATASDDGTVVIWSVRKAVPLRTLRGHTSHVLCVAFNPKSNILASGGWDESVILWNVQKGTKIKTLQAHSDPVSSLGYNPDGTIILTGSYDGLMRLWDATTGQCLKTIEDEQNAPIAHAAFTPNGQYIISSSLSSTIRLWDYRHARVIKTFTGHRGVKFGCGVVVMAGGARGGTGQGETNGGEEELASERVADGESVMQTDQSGSSDIVNQTDAEPNGAQPTTHDQEDESRQAKKRKLDHEPSPSLAKTIPSNNPPPPTSTSPADDADAAADSTWIITGTDTEDIVIWDLQSRRILQRLHTRTYAIPESERASREQLRSSASAADSQTQAQGEVGRNAGVIVDEREEDACLALAGHPYRRELAIGGLGKDCVVRVWRDGAV